MVGRWWWLCLVALSILDGPRQIFDLPFGFATIIIELTNQEDSEIGASSIKLHFILSTSFLSLSFNAIATRRGAWMTGSAVDLN